MDPGGKGLSKINAEVREREAVSVDSCGGYSWCGGDGDVVH